MTDTSAREAYELRMHVGKQLGKVGTQSVRPVLERLLREEADEINCLLR